MKRILPVCLALATASASGGINTWTMTGPDAGAVNTVAIHPADSQIAIMATSRGLYRTINGGNSWTLVNEYLYQTATSIAFDPTDPNHVFATNGRLWHSEDAGQTFTTIADTSLGHFYTVGFSHAGTLYAHTNSGQVLRSTNRGAAWTNCALPGGAHGDSRAFAVDPNSNVQDHLFIGIQTGLAPASTSSTWRSVDGCSSWTVAGTGNPGDHAGGAIVGYSVMPGNPDRVLAATNRGLSLSIDGGATWDYTYLTNGWSVNFDPTPSGSGQVLAVVGSAGTIIVSPDGGENWIFRGSLYTIGDSKLTFDPQVPGRVFGATLQGAYLSTNGGASFALRMSGVRGGFVSDFSAANDGTVYTVFNQGASGVFRRDRITRDWGPVANQDLIPGMPGPRYMSHVATAPTNSQRLYAGAFTGFMVQSLDAGATWGPYYPQYISPLATVIDTVVDPDDELVAYTSTSSQGLWKTSDGGANWTQLTNGLTLNTWSIAAARGSDVVYVAAGGFADPFPRLIYKSVDGGQSWAATGFSTLSPNSGSVSEIVIDPTDHDVVYAPSVAGIWKTTNGGTSWQLMSFPGVSDTTFSGSGIAVDPVYPTTIVASRTIDGALARTVDGGQNWERISLTLPGAATLFERILLDPLRPNLIIAAVNAADIGEFEVATDFSVQISNVPAQLSSSTSFTPNFTVQNSGPYGASPSELIVDFPSWITPTLPSNCTRSGQSLTCRVGSLPNGGSYTQSLALAISAAGGSGQLTARLQTHESDLLPGNSSQSQPITAVERADLALTLAPASATIERGTTTSLTATVLNRGPSGSTGSSLSLQIPAGLAVQSHTASQGACTAAGASYHCALNTIAANGNATVTLVLMGTAAGSHTVTGHADGNGLDTGIDQDAVRQVVVRSVGDVSVSLTKSADPVTIGTHFSYTATLSHVSGDASGVHLTMPVTGAAITGITQNGAICTVAGGTVECDVASLGAGASASVTVHLDALAAGIATATATATYLGSDMNPGNNSASIGTTLRRVGDLSVEIADSADPATLNVPFNYTVTLRNAGPNEGAAQVVIPVTGASVTAATSPQATCAVAAATATCDVPSLASGASAAIQLTVIASSTGTAGASATATFGGIDTDPANNSATASTTVRRVGDVGVAVTDSVDPVTTGVAFNYTVTVTNGGPNAGGVSVSIPVSGGTVASATLSGGTCTSAANSVSCDIPSLASDAAAVITINVSASVAGVASATATATFDGLDPVAANNSATANTVVNAPPPSGGGGGGGGGGGRVDWLFAALLGALLARRQLRLLAAAHPVRRQQART